jgi:hypothetical protein
VAARLNLDSRIRGTWNHQDGVDPYGRPVRPEGSGQCWYCWAPTGDMPFEKAGRTFCSGEHARAYYGRAGLVEIEEEELDAAYEEAIDAESDAEHRVREAEAELDDAEDELRAARDRVSEIERAIKR